MDHHDDGDTEPSHPPLRLCFKCVGLLHLPLQGLGKLRKPLQQALLGPGIYEV